MSSRQKITKEYIVNLLKEYETCIISWPDVLGSKATVKFKCANKTCNVEVDKQIRYIQKNGAYCKTCLLSNPSYRKKIEHVEQKEVKQYNREYVFNLLKKYDATLVKDIDNINRDTQIYYRCHCSKKFNKYNKSIRNMEISGVYCEDCLKEKSKSKRTQTNNERYGVEHTYELHALKDDD